MNHQFHLKYAIHFLLFLVIVTASSCSRPKEELFALYNPSDPDYSVSTSHIFVMRSKEKGGYFNEQGQHVPDFSKFVETDLAEGALKVYYLYKEKEDEKLYRVWKTLSNDKEYESGYITGGADLFGVYKSKMDIMLKQNFRVLKLKFDLPASGDPLGVFKVNKTSLKKNDNRYIIELDIANSSLDGGSITNSFYLIHNDIIISKMELDPNSTLHFDGQEQKSVIFFTNENLDYITTHLTDGLELVNTMQNWILKM